jgi:hypothetical protein
MQNRPKDPRAAKRGAKNMLGDLPTPNGRASRLVEEISNSNKFFMAFNQVKDSRDEAKEKESRTTYALFEARKVNIR